MAVCAVLLLVVAACGKEDEDNIIWDIANFKIEIKVSNAQGQDITSQVTEAGTITTPVINSEYSTLFVTFETSSDAVQDIEKSVSDVRILGKEGGISVQNAKAGDVLQVYDIDGQLLLSERLDSDKAEIALDSKKLYVIKVADKVVKVRL